MSSPKWILGAALVALACFSACDSDLDLTDDTSVEESVTGSGCTRDQPAEARAALDFAGGHGGGHKACSTCHIDEEPGNGGVTSLKASAFHPVVTKP